MKIILLAAAVLSGVGQSSSAQSVPEGIHRLSQGAVELCGMTGPDVAGLRLVVRASSRFAFTPIDSPRFELYTHADGLSQLVFTTPSEAAYPAATCRGMYQQDGTWRMHRSMRCEAGRSECDALFLEFQALDAQMTRSMQARD